MNLRKGAGFLKKGGDYLMKIILAWLMIILTGMVLGLFIAAENGSCRELIENDDDIGRFLLDLNEGLKRHAFLIYIIDFDDFMCMSCLNSFIEFYHVLPPPFQNEWAIGILVDSHQDQGENRLRSQKIIKKKLNGFMMANRIEFPIFIDSSETFKNLGSGGTSVIIFSQGLESSRKYVFPLSSSEKEEIFQALY